MKIGPKYKICRRVGDRIFEKCCSEKFEMTPSKNLFKSKRGRRRNVSEYGQQLLEKQKVRFTYGINEKQFSNYVKRAVSRKDVTPSDYLYKSLEKRLDNVVYRLGLSSSRIHARQMVSHGHIKVNGQRVNIPSYKVKAGDSVSIKDRIKKSPMIVELAEKLEAYKQPKWMTLDHKKFEAKIEGSPKFDVLESTFNLKAVLEYYSR